MLLKNGKHLHDTAAVSCPYHSMARFRYGRQRRSWQRAHATSALTVPDTNPLAREMVAPPALSPSPVVQHILLADHFLHIKDVFSTHRASMTPADFVVAWVRLAKITKAPAERLSPEMQKFVDIMACATIDRMQQFLPSHLCSIIWAASKLKKDVAHSGMFKSFLKAWEAETESHLDKLELDQIRKCMAAITRVGFTPGPNWKLKVETVLTRRIGACACAKTLACCLVSAASLGFALHPSPAFREAIAGACMASFGKPGLRGVREAPRYACSALWAAAVLGVPLSNAAIQILLSHVMDANVMADSSIIGKDAEVISGDAGATVSRAAVGNAAASTVVDTEAVASTSSGSDGGSSLAVPALTPLDFAQVFWALSKLRYTPRAQELSCLLSGTVQLLPNAQPELLATILWGLADLEVAPPDSWLQLTYSSFERQLDAASAEPLQALLHAAASLQLPAPQWSGRLMERLQDVDLRVLPDGNVVDLVMSMHALSMHPPPQLAHRLQQECIKRLAMRSTAGTAPAAGGGC
ncbi:hypothetical protein Vretimale_2043 [Volvox reticuliferus]|uniref:Uncharacterized protein n=1 Tax=Volvox reticuliferus TaxID=1737510 RepID=A0A8J4D5Q2_9CHLO|nr:hypothetical protein Vretifemale_4347 [Volvox reticuliferus]GIL96165.1 hypothetical protein Vretimale_2043 [Volvox reticuliferus]